MGKKQKNQKTVMSEKKDTTPKVYEHFFNQKYNKYKRQFSKMNHSEIASKIMKEWKALEGAAKENLQNIYEEKRTD